MISPLAAIATAAIAVVAVALAIVSRRSPPRTTGPTVTAQTDAPDAARPDAPAEPAAASAPPKIGGVKAEAAVGSRGVDLSLEVAVVLANELAPKTEFVHVKASCLLDGEWFGAAGSLHATRLPAGTNIVRHQLTLGVDHAFTTTPTLCVLGFEYLSFATKPSTKLSLAKLCWDGQTVVDKPCLPPTRADGRVRVSALRVQSSLDRFRGRRAGAPVDLEVALDAELASPLDGWSLEVAADCVLPDGTTQSSSSTIFTSDLRTGRPFTGKTYLFMRGQQMLDVPQSCTVNVQLADRHQLVRAPVAAWCWRGGSVASGACA